MLDGLVRIAISRLGLCPGKFALRVAVRLSSLGNSHCGQQPGGILCDITFMKGPHLSALKGAESTQTIDKLYFKVLVMAPYSAKLDAHLQVHLSYPGNVASDFVKEFTGLVNEFQKYVD